MTDFYSSEFRFIHYEKATLVPIDKISAMHMRVFLQDWKKFVLNLLIGTCEDFHFEATILSILYISTEKLLPTCTTILHMAQQLQLEYLKSLFIE